MSEQFVQSYQNTGSNQAMSAAPTRARAPASGTSGKKGRKSRVASTAASPLTIPLNFDNTNAGSGPTSANGSGSVQWATPLASIGQSSSRAGTPVLTAKLDELTTFNDTVDGPSAAIVSRGGAGKVGADDDGDGDDEFLPDMADDDYSAQLSWQSQTKDNLKVLMDNFTPEQYDRYEAYRRNALPKQAIRRVIQQSLGQQISLPVAQVVAGFAKVFVGEIVEKARANQQNRGDSGPLSPDHLREAYREYQEEAGRVGTSRPLRGKKLFVR